MFARFISFFNLSNREFGAILGLGTLIFVIKFLPAFYEFSTNPVTLHQKDSLALVRLLHLPRENTIGRELKRKRKEWTRTSAGSKLFEFDPNTADLGQWESLGLSERQALAILNYRRKGGHFKNTSDLKRMYTISEKMYARIAPYVKIQYKSSDSSSRKIFHAGLRKQVQIDVDLNEADSAELCKIRGIGSVFAKRIVTYRNRLGGFSRKDQLMEVFGIDSGRYEQIAVQCIIGDKVLRKIEINSADFERLRWHPYLKFNEVRAIIAYRNQHGYFSSAEDLKKVVILSPETILKLTPYLIF